MFAYILKRIFLMIPTLLAVLLLTFVVIQFVPGGPVERTIEYVAPFDRCDRERDYETAWKFFEEKYGK